MSKTVDELMAVYDAAGDKLLKMAGAAATAEGLNEAHRAGIAAVIRAVRDAAARSEYPLRMLNEILGDAGEKVAEYTGGMNDLSVTPATDPAPAVCEWTGEEYVTYSTSCESEHEVDPHKAPPKHCPSCGLPIKFTEAK